MDRSPSTIEQEHDSQNGTAASKRSTEPTEYDSIERIFESRKVPSWQNQLTLRAFVVSFVLGILFTFIVMKLNLTTGIIPSLNVSAGLLGFFFVKTWTKFLGKSGLLKQPFTRQENTVIQTCVVATSGIAFSGGFGSYLFGMSERIAKQSKESISSQNTKDPSLGWMIAFLFVVSFLGLFCVVPLRKIMIIDFKLIYPSGTATAHLINSFHTPQGAKLAKKQVRTLGRFFSFSFVWGFFQWFFTGGDNCGFSNFPTLGLEAYKNKFYFDFSATYVGVGMICPYLINVSLLVGAILSWGVMWPLINEKKGTWYPADLPDSSLHGLQGYRVFIGIAMILGDGLYNFVKVLGHTLFGLYHQFTQDRTKVDTITGNSSPDLPSLSYDDEKRTRLFLKDQIPTWIAIIGYLTIAIASVVTLPHIFHQLKWYYIAAIYVFAPALAFCNAYGCGLTDWSLASTYGKLAIFVIGAWAGGSNGGVLAGLAACGVMMNIVSTASDLTQDFKTGYMTLASPRSMFVSQVIGTAMGCIISPCVFWLFYKAFDDLGIHGSEYPAPYAIIYRNMAILGVEGFSTLPHECLVLCYAFFGFAIAVNGLRDLLGKNVAKFIPIPMAMAIPFYIGGYFAIDMCVGSLILFIWSKINKAKAAAFGPAVASGLICGDGIWTLPSSILALAGVNPPICMKFLSRSTNVKVDKFLGL
ncbi:putative oligopeptide transporter, OPT superfamily [Helianthus annuus]|uniref:Oligopeptide transporter, OPT superfamily n=1 Tax=Helianthus annuus TaxID=4232 RepID=A0A251TW06_HELAN|nr:probable metal-nicotianamine transporter YSL7 [Helianthus annuus]KAF5791117.1 putative oligopeptide transporter, OPT superfamily [Helianthus annuus]KAJ0526233.1 putative oligopeptide transporter, OPT superfamily [Helianthus annuus]KAJ0707683.1 putative oligopeptide transporter, OPT superfamily [Helianthus annuus]KAJ0753639.1 putative oligopeptide transporter, OPT superfamily [Helianthus annuus]KAJ0893383.1 putative oligopeptide transporter, OPT superfamily [Helianthus annuus]